jgi:photosystem II stability/assembly factor-like uncharacterized protein
VPKIVPALLVPAIALLVVGCSGQPVAPAPSATHIWKPLATVPTSPGALSLARLRMISATTGWALAVPGDGRGLGHLVRTTDGGAHWDAIGLPSNLTSPKIDAVDFHDAMQAWVLVVLGAESTASRQLAVVVSTADGGRHWSTTPKVAIDGQAVGIQFVDAAHGWVFALPGAGGAIGAADTTLYRTVDGGARWQAIKAPSEVRGDPAVVAGLPEACPMGGLIGQPVFADSLNGWLGGFCPEPFFYVTRDGGRSWSRQNVPAFPGPPPSAAEGPYQQYAVDPVQRMSATDLVVFFHRGVTTGANALQAAAIYVTHDAGTSWTALRLPYAELVADFVDAMHGWMIAAGPGGNTGQRSLYSTVDGGREWRLADGPHDYFGQDLNFIDATTGFIASGPLTGQPSQLLRTTDGGATWLPIASTID